VISIRTIVKSRIPEIIGVANERADEACEITAFNLVHLAAGRSRVKTGNMRAGWEMDKINHGRYVVFNNVHYTIYNEYGTVYMPAQPMLGPSIEEEQPRFEARIRAAYA
jgi:hypothetical protein